MLISMLTLILFQQVAVAGTKYWVQAKENTYHYGCSSDIYVNYPNPRVDLVKVTAVWATRTDEASFTEVGHAWMSNGDSPNAFWAYRNNWAYTMSPELDSVTPNTYVRYHCGYDYSSNLHYMWVKGNIVKSVSIPNMTTCWPVTNAEREVGSDPYCDNLACFKTLKFKNYAWGSWSDWAGSNLWYDNDQLYSNSYVSATHVDVVR